MPSRDPTHAVTDVLEDRPEGCDYQTLSIVSGVSLSELSGVLSRLETRGLVECEEGLYSLTDLATGYHHLIDLA